MVKDPETGEIVPIFNPCQQAWKEHFRWDRVQVVGLTATGRATIDALATSNSGRRGTS